MPSTIRLKRISDRIRELLAEMLVKEAADPRLEGISVTDVKVDRELTYADVFVSAVEGEERKKEILAALERAQGFLRSSLAGRVDLRVFPRLRFHWDPTPERADHIERILATLRTEESLSPPVDEPAQREDEEENGD